MAKKVKKRVQRQTVEAMMIPTAANAKWLGIGFIASVLAVTLGMILIMHAHIH